MERRPSLILLVLALSGCASIPNVTYKYYPIKWNTTVTVIQTVGCNAAKTKLIALYAPLVTTSYSSNFEEQPFEFRVKELDRFFADVEMAMNFTDDGRLKSINQSSTGQGETIVKSAVALITSVEGMHLGPLGMVLPVEKPGPSPSQCNDIEKWGGGKPVTLVYKASVTKSNRGQQIRLKAAPESEGLYDELEDALPILTIDVGNEDNKTLIESGAIYANDQAADVVLLRLQKSGPISLSIRSSIPDKEIGNARITVPTEHIYSLPIPKAALFGKQSFALALSESGTVTSVSYGKTTGAVGALNAAGAVATMETAATKAATLRGENDFIAQQERRVLCITKPEQCK